MPRPQTDIDAGRERLAELAMALVTERGSQALTMNELAARAGMSTANIYRYFDSKDALLEALAELWFRPKVAIMEEVLASDLPPRRKMYEFFARRFARLRESYYADPIAFETTVEIGNDHFELIRSYIDLGDHYLAVLIGEAMDEGHFAGLEVDDTISIINQMVSCYCNIAGMGPVMDRLSEAKLARIIDAIFDGLSAADRGARAVTGLRAA
ncbi:TetR/AcrR family transcriptional regulator [Novosphingobium lentum]|uniref:TetR/AcrR family transcriptional regulator n=1 Tax=Novosphingobium lentum TaxID=145287 RepID=UPI000831E7BA|nr:TetR/AcrR family transcriptional regulator [Novosphingobium lentum]